MFHYTWLWKKDTLLAFTAHVADDYLVLVRCSPFYLHGLTFIPAWISNYIHYEVWGEITYPFLNFNSATVEV